MKQVPGSVTLLSALLIAAILLSVVVIGAASWIQERQATTASVNKKMAEAVVTGCMEHVIQTLGQNANYLGDETMPIAGVTCTIYPVQFSGGIWTLGTSANVTGQQAKLKAVLSQRAPPVVQSWEQVSSLP